MRDRGAPSRVAGLVIGAALGLLTFETARADNAVVLESHVGARTADAAKLLVPVRRELTLLGYLADPAKLGPMVEERLSRDGNPLSAAEVSRVRTMVTDGYDVAYVQGGDFELAATRLQEALDVLLDSPAAFATDQALRDDLLKALIGLALAHKRLGHVEQAAAFMAEVVRSFPDRAFNRTLFGPEPQELFLAVKRELEAQKPASLAITVDADDAVVFVNGRYVGVGAVELDAVVPGTYRVYVQKGTRSGRLHLVDLSPGDQRRLDISWITDGALRTDAELVGLVFADEAERAAHEAHVAASVARSLRSGEVVVLRVGTHDGRRAVIGSVLSADTGRAVRTGILATEPLAPGHPQLEGLARFLSGGEPIPGLIVPGAEDPTTTPPAVGIPARDRGRTPWYHDAWGWTAVGAGLAAAGAGLWLHATAGEWEDDAASAPSESESKALLEHAEDQRTLGGILTVGGGVLTAVGVVMLAVNPAPDDAPARMSAGPGWLVVYGRF